MANVILFGLTEVSEVMHYYLTHDSRYRVAAFTVDEKYMNCESFCGLPVFPFENIERTHPPTDYDMCVILGYRDVNRLREEKYREAKTKGYRMITYVSSKATTWPGVEIGENSFIFEQSVIMPFSKVGNNVVIQQGCVIGHHSTVADHSFLSSNTVLLGCVSIGRNCILGASATIKDLVTIADSCIIGVGTTMTKNTRPGQVYVSSPPTLLQKSSDQLKYLLTWSAGFSRKKKTSPYSESKRVK